MGSQFVYNRFDALSFTIRKVFYLGFRKIPGLDGSSKDFFSVELQGSGAWRNLAITTNGWEGLRRRSGVSFVLHGKANNGAGINVVDSTEKLLNDFLA